MLARFAIRKGNIMELLEKNIYNGLDIYRENSQEVYTRQQLGQALGYKDPKNAISHIHRRHKDELDRFSGVVNVSTPSGKQDVFVYNIWGVLRICIYSGRPRAKELLLIVTDRLENTLAAQQVTMARQSAKIDRLQAKAERLETNLSNTRASYKAEKAENKRLATIAGLEQTKEGRTARAFHDALKMAVVEGGYRLDKARSRSVDRASRQCIGVYEKEYLYMPLELMQWVYNQYAPEVISCFTLRADLEKAGVMAKNALGKSYGRTINGKKEDCERILIRYVEDIVSIRL